MSDREVSSLLVIILDTNPVWWGCRVANDQLQLSHCLDAILMLAKSHMMLAESNKLAVIAAHIGISVFLYPMQASHHVQCTSDVGFGGDAPDVSIPDGDQNFFRDLEEAVDKGMKQLLCHDINRIERECSFGEMLSSRVLILKGAEDNPLQYMNFMNAVFTAQKQNVVIDVCLLDSDSGLMQQACDITGGIYLKVPLHKSLPFYLLWLFLPDPVTRKKMTLPQRARVDYRAACFCHHVLIDIGYVCSVCLSSR